MLHCQLCSTHYTVATMKITDNFCYKWMCLPQKLTLFVVSKDEWNTKEGIGKSMNNELHVHSMEKCTSWAEATLNHENQARSSNHCQVMLV